MGVFVEALATVFALGSVWYFLLTAGWVVLLFYWVEKEFIFWSGFNIVLYILFLQFIIHRNVFGGFFDHPTRTLIILLWYIVIGFIWSFVKWWLFVNKKALAYKMKRMDWLQSQQKSRSTKSNMGIPGLENITLETAVPASLVDEWKHFSGFGYNPRPKALEHKKLISHWVVYWPISALWSLLDDFVGKMMRMIIVKIRFIYDGITKNA